MEDTLIDIFAPSADLTDFVPGEWGTELAGGSIGLSQSVICDPAGDAAIWNQQDTPFTCAVVCQQMILGKESIPPHRN